jgi:hypothetical protein
LCEQSLSRRYDEGEEAIKISMKKKLLMVAILSMVLTALIGKKVFAISEFKLTASDAAAGDLFGHAISINGDRVVVGAFGDDDAGSASGSAYVFRYDGGVWVEEAKLTASDAAAYDWFGYAVSISGDRVVVGAYRDDEAGVHSGSAYVFMHRSCIPDVKANGSDGPVTISQSDTLSVTIALNAAGNTDNADWWVGVFTPFGWYYYNLFLGWQPGFVVTYQGPLFDLSPFEVLNISGLPVGPYTFFFGVDMLMNGSLDLAELYYDSVGVTIESE